MVNNWKEKYELNKLITEYDKILELAHEILNDTDEGDYTLNLISMKDLLLNHFTNEESLMLEMGYYGFVEHKKNHDIILSKLNRILISSMDSHGFRQIVKRFVNYLIQRHFMGLDRKLNNYINTLNEIRSTDSKPDTSLFAM